MFDERPDTQARSGGELAAWMTTVNAAGQVRIHIQPTRLRAS